MSDWKRLRTIVEEALDVPAAERNAWLDGACDGDAGLRARAQRLLDASLAEDGFLRPPSVPAEGDGIGPYRLVRRLASGGMGTVYVAERDQPHRRVALKLMRAGLLGKEAVARFRYEVEVLASLQHPHIAAMYETGLHEELPWFAMEFVEDARTIVAYAAEERLDLGARLSLFETVCDAVHHGHAKGVLHRDLKPDNLLVGRDGRCKVIDFGVARVVDADGDLATLRTSTGEIVGTLAYMSPEQVVGDRDAVDTRSDVYALGVVLFELLTGAQPYAVRGKTFFEAVQTIRDAPPSRPGALRPELKGDLETILLKCLAKEPERRYASAAALADDLRRYRAHEPVAARAPSVTYQLRTFARRNRVLVGAAATVLAVSVAAAVVSAVWATRASDAREAMRQERDTAQELFATLLDRAAEATFRHSMRVQDLSGGAEPAIGIVRDAIADLEALLAVAPGDLNVRYRLIQAHLRLGQLRGDPAVTTSSGRLERSRKAYATALDLARALHEERPADAPAAHLHGRAMTLVARATRDAALCGKGVALMEDVLARGVGRTTEGINLMRHIAYAYQTLGVWCTEAKDLKGGLAHFVRQRELLTEATRLAPDHFNARFDLARCRSNLAGIAAAGGDYAVAAEEYAGALDVFEALRKEAPESQMYLGNVAWNALQLGRCRALSRDPAAAEPLVRRALGIWKGTVASNPDSVEDRVNLCSAQLTLGGVLVQRSRDAEDKRPLLEEARDAYGAALTLARSLPEPPVPIRALEARHDGLNRALAPD